MEEEEEEEEGPKSSSKPSTHKKRHSAGTSNFGMSLSAEYERREGEGTSNNQPYPTNACYQLTQRVMTSKEEDIEKQTSTTEPRLDNHPKKMVMIAL